MPSSSSTTELFSRFKKKKIRSCFLNIIIITKLEKKCAVIIFEFQTHFLRICLEIELTSYFLKCQIFLDEFISRMGASPVSRFWRSIKTSRQILIYGKNLLLIQQNKLLLNTLPPCPSLSAHCTNNSVLTIISGIYFNCWNSEKSFLLALPKSVALTA